jgi:hypothetical protein
MSEIPPEKRDADRQDPPRRDPWDPIFGSADHFLVELECTREMFTLVAPILEANDAERKKRIEALGEPIKDEEKGRTGIELKSLSDLQEFKRHISRMRRGDLMFRRNVIVGLVSQFDDFLVDVIRVAYLKNSDWLKSAEKKLSYKEVLETSSLDELKKELIVREVNQLMRDSHHAQISFLDEKLKLGIEASFEGWRNFLELTERRNLFVHNGGCVNSTYIDNSKRYGFPLNPKYVDGRPLTVSDEYISDTIDCLHELTLRIAQAAARRLFPDCFEEADRSLNNQTVDLLSDERWNLAERIFEYALGIPDKLRSGSEYKFYSLLNLCIALKFSGKKFKSHLQSVDWEPMHPKYHFAIAVLEDRFDEAADMMKSEAVLKEIDKEQLLSWPLLRSFRKTDQFSKAFDEIFSPDERESLLIDAREQLDAEQDGADQPATAPESELVDKEKPQPESEGRSQ